MIVLRALVRGCIYDIARVAYLQALVQHSKMEFQAVKSSQWHYQKFHAQPWDLFSNKIQPAAALEIACRVIGFISM
jgi:hypothetical protein